MNIAFDDVQAFSEICLKAKAPDQIAAALTKVVMPAGITTWYAGSVLHNSLLPKQGFGFAEQIPAWRKRYDDARHCDVDPVFRHAAASEDRVVWSDCRLRAASEGATKRALSVFDEAGDFELTDGLTKAWRGFGSAPGAISFAGRRPDLSPQTQTMLLLVGAFAFEGFRRVVEGFKPIPPRLTPRELDVLAWTAEGKTAWEIGEILDIGEHTVRDHLKQLRQKYGVGTIVQVVVLAMLDGTLKPAPSTPWK